MSDDDVIIKNAKIVEPEEKLGFKHLTEKCGHHCGAIATIGSDFVNVGHCSCVECHNFADSSFT